MKRLFIALLVISVTLLLACSSETSNEGEVTFIGKIESIDGQTAIVKIEEGEKILKSGDKAGVDISVAGDIEFKIGDKIKVKHSGEVMEKYPLGINTISVELVGID